MIDIKALGAGPARVAPGLAEEGGMTLENARVGSDPYAPAELAELVQGLGEAKARLPAVKTLVLALLGGAYIAFGAALYLVVVAESGLGPGLARWVGGFAFSLGLVMIVIGGAELFTGNSLMAMAWAARRITLGRLARNWGLVLLGNLAGALGALLLFRLAELPAGAAAEAAKGVAAAKLALEPVPAFFRGLLCNVFVCMAVWLSLAARQVAGKVLCVMLPVAAFVALGLEHSVANFFFLPLGQWLEGAWDLEALARNLAPVILGNVAGGAGLVAAVYWLVYLRRART